MRATLASESYGRVLVGFPPTNYGHTRFYTGPEALKALEVPPEPNQPAIDTLIAVILLVFMLYLLWRKVQ